MIENILIWRRENSKITPILRKTAHFSINILVALAPDCAVVWEGLCGEEAKVVWAK